MWNYNVSQWCSVEGQRKITCAVQKSQIWCQWSYSHNELQATKKKNITCCKRDIHMNKTWSISLPGWVFSVASDKTQNIGSLRWSVWLEAPVWSQRRDTNTEVGVRPRVMWRDKRKSTQVSQKSSQMKSKQLCSETSPIILTVQAAAESLLESIDPVDKQRMFLELYKEIARVLTKYIHGSPNLMILR